jgi:hypothetical protein
MRSTEFSITEQGELRITLTSQGAAELERLLTQHPDWNEADIFLELIDLQLSNGWYVVPPEQIRAQTLSLILTHSVTYDQSGEITRIGAAYWYPAYEHETYATTLFKNGQLVLEKAAWIDTL